MRILFSLGLFLYSELPVSNIAQSVIEKKSIKPGTPKDYGGICRLSSYMNKDEGSEENHCYQRPNSESKEETSVSGQGFNINSSQLFLI